MQAVSPAVKTLGRAVLGLDQVTIREKYALLDSAPLPVLIATKIILEQHHSADKRAINTVNLYIRIQSARANLVA